MVMIHIGVLIMSGIITMIYNHRNHGYDAYWGALIMYGIITMIYNHKNHGYDAYY